MTTNQRTFIDFKLYLTCPPGEDSACQVALLPTAEVGETVSPVTVPVDERPSTEDLELLAAKKVTLKQLIALGKKLANCLLPARDVHRDIRGLFQQAYNTAGPGRGVRLRLIIADDELKLWPWEYTYWDFLGGAESTSMSGFLVLDGRVSLVRHEPLPYPHPSRTKTAEDLTDIRVAFACALPKGERKLELRQDLNMITEAVRKVNEDGLRFVLKPKIKDATPLDLENKLPKGTHIFHFAGHASPQPAVSSGGLGSEAALLLVADKNTKDEVKLPASLLAQYLQQAGVRLVVLGACNTAQRIKEEDAFLQKRSPWDGLASALAAKEIPAIVGMQYEVFDDSARAFSEQFYRALASGLSLDEAMSGGRRAMARVGEGDKSCTNLEWGVPVLYTRLPDGKLFPERMELAGETAAQVRSDIMLPTEFHDHRQEIYDKFENMYSKFEERKKLLNQGQTHKAQMVKQAVVQDLREVEHKDTTEEERNEIYREFEALSEQKRGDPAGFARTALKKIEELDAQRKEIYDEFEKE
ncbi:MAG: CHAT domain-containing protein [Halobacteriota archaeon]